MWSLYSYCEGKKDHILQKTSCRTSFNAYNHLHFPITDYFSTNVSLSKSSHLQPFSKHLKKPVLSLVCPSLAVSTFSDHFCVGMRWRSHNQLHTAYISCRGLWYPIVPSFLQDLVPRRQGRSTMGSLCHWSANETNWPHAEKIKKRKTSEQYTTAFAVNEEWALWQPLTEQRMQALWASSSVIMYREKPTDSAAPLSPIQRWWCACYVLKRSIVHPPMLKTFIRQIALTKGSLWSEIPSFNVMEAQSCLDCSRLQPIASRASISGITYYMLLVTSFALII